MRPKRCIKIESTPAGSRFEGFNVVLHHSTPTVETKVTLRTFWIKDSDALLAEQRAMEFAEIVGRLTETEVDFR